MDVVVEKGGAGGETKARCGIVDKAGLARMIASGRVHVEVTAGSATSWDRPAERSYLVRVRRDDLAVIVGWGLSHRSAESLAERLVELLGLGSRAAGSLKAWVVQVSTYAYATPTGPGCKPCHLPSPTAPPQDRALLRLAGGAPTPSPGRRALSPDCADRPA